MITILDAISTELIKNKQQAKAIAACIEAFHNSGQDTTHVTVNYLDDQHEMLTEIIGNTENVDNASIILYEELYEILVAEEENSDERIVYFVPMKDCAATIQNLIETLHSQGLISIFSSMTSRIDAGM